LRPTLPFTDRLIVSIRLSLCSVIAPFRPPQERGNFFEETSTIPGHRNLTRAAIPFFCSDPIRFADESGEIRIFFAGALPAAAPAVMFLLKRKGLSAARVQVVERGLAVTARR
jgi:hypothetical protein